MSDACSGPPAELDPDEGIEIQLPNKHVEQENTSSFLDRFLSSFFDERNIKWLLVIGAGIVFGSSLMLVTREWSHWPLTLKYLTLLGYTAAGFCAAELCRKRLGLRTTAKVLYSLTLLLLPICFLSLSWISSTTATQVNLSFVELLLLVPAFALTWFASNRIFDFLLNGRQTTFVLSYQLLCVAGIIPGAGSALFAVGLMLSLWLVFTAGVIKVNRHIFWLTEERRESRIFGFFPIALLGLQFLTLVGTKCLPVAPTEWLGFGCVLVALTIMATARTVADVFRQRTGDLIESLPWGVVIPLFSGLVLTSAGVMLSFTGFPDSSALIPATALAAVLMAWSGYDTKHPGFVWMSLLFAAIAYQCTPTLFRDFAEQLRDSAATTIGEQKLPIAFYGLTYLPLLASTAWGSRCFRLRANLVFSRPMQQFTTIVSMALFALAITNTKALLVVSVVNLLTFSGMAIIFRDRRYAVGSIIAIYAAAWSVIPCLNGMPEIERINPAAQNTVLALVAALMTATRLPGRIVNSIPATDGFLQGFLVRSDGTHRNLCQLSGCIVTSALLGCWFGDAGLSFGDGLTIEQLWQFCILLATFALYAIRNPSYLAGILIWTATGFATLCYFAGPVTSTTWPLLNGSSNVAVAASAVGLLCLYFSGHLNRNSSLKELRRQLTNRNSLHADAANESLDGWTRQTLAFVVPLCDLSLMILCCLAVLYHIPLLFAANFAARQPSILFATSAAVTWLIAAGAITKHRGTAVTGMIILPLWVSGMVAATWPDSFSSNFYPTIWAIASGCCYLFAKRRESWVSPAVARVNQLWLLVIIAACCLSFELLFRLASGIVLAAFAAAHWRHLNPAKRTWLAITANIQCLYLAAAIGGLSGFMPSVLINANLILAAPVILFGTAISVAFFSRNSDLFDRRLVQVWNIVLDIGIVTLTGLSFGSASYMNFHCAIMLAGLTITAITDFTSGIRRQKVEHIWFSLSMPGLAALWMLRHGFTDIGSDVSQCVLLGAAVLCLIGSRLYRKESRYKIAAQPLRLIGQTLPALVVLLCAGRAVLFSGMHMPGLHTLTMFGSAAVYFHQALVTRQRRFAIASLGILNLTLMLLWNSLGLRDAQFYMVPVGLSIIGLVELLKRQLPESSHNLLRYVGALTILVSPVFEIIGGSWLHLLALMLFSVVIVLLAIGLRLKALMYTGSAFLMADLVGMVVRSTIDNPSLLWICGVVLGAAVIGLAAFCENHRDRLLQRIRFLSAELATWQ